VTFAQAAALPMAGLTALVAIEHGRSLLARSVLVTGALRRSRSHRLPVGLAGRRAGSRQVRHSAVSPAGAGRGRGPPWSSKRSIAAAAPFGPYHLIVEQLGGQALAEAMTQLALRELRLDRVSIGVAGYEVLIDMARMRRAPGACLRILNLYQELEREPASVGLQRLVRLVGAGNLTPHLGVEAGWREIARSRRR